MHRYSKKILTMLKIFFFVSEALVTTKDSNYYPLVITYHRNSIFAHNAGKGVRWTPSFSVSTNIGYYTRRLR